MDKYKECETERDKYAEAILSSDSNKKIIVAGPGTGKSYVFQKICKNNLRNGKTNNLVLSFINELVDDLKIDLHELAEVKTLHSFALGHIDGTKNLFMDLEQIIEDDYTIINDKKIDYKTILCNLIDCKDDLEFYFKRREYYNHFGPNCSIYTLVKMFEADENIIPKYSQILIDEFQDFNKLEAKLIDLLSCKNPLLIVGDDDQSLYSFKHANPNEIRLKCKDQRYTLFELPFCSRCPEVIINSFNSIVAKAKEKGFLKGRRDKQYKYYPSPEKDKISSENPKILVKKQIYQKQVAYNIEQEIKKLFHPRQRMMSVLIICSLRNQIDDLRKKLQGKGFNNVHARLPAEKKPLVEGFDLLLKNKECNLGWRIVSKHLPNIIENDKFISVLKESHKKVEKIKFKELLSTDVVTYVKSILVLLNKIKRNEQITKDEYAMVFDCFGYNPDETCLQKLKYDLFPDNTQKNIYSKISIKITTILGSKGLTSDYIFLVNSEDKYILGGKNNEITDEKICKYLVVLTRAKRRVYIYTGENKLPTFVKWIDSKYYEEK